MSNAALAQKIYDAACTLPDTQAQEALDFIHFLSIRQDMQEFRNLRDAQQTALNALWNNDADEAWNDV